ncbi:hypothetical protein LINPERPRIM_LOCUS1614 [Linum perenne]
MEGFGFSDASSAVRKKRSSTSRRPRPESQLPSDPYDVSSLSSTPPSDNNTLKADDGGFVESDEASNNSGSFRGSNNDQRHSVADSRRCSEGVLAPANWKNSTTGNFEATAASDGAANSSKFKKVKLKLGGVTRTINANSPSDGASAVGPSSTKSSHFPGSEHRPTKDNLVDNNRSITSDRASVSRGAWKDLPKSSSSGGRGENSKGKTLNETRVSPKQADSYEPVRKSKRVPKKRLLDDMFDDGLEDGSGIKASYGMEFEDEDEAGSRKQRRLSKVMKKNVDVLYDVEARGSSRPGKEGNKKPSSKSGKVSEDTDYMEDHELASDDELGTKKKRVARKELVVDLSVESKKEMTVTTRQRALQTGKDGSSTDLGGGGGVIEFPNGLPPAPPKKQKEKLTEVEQQLKRAEALQRRRLQVEKAARESEAEAIRKILGQDSSRKKREEKVKKRQEEIAQAMIERAANFLTLASDRVRWVDGPSGTVVTFPEEIGLPSIFHSKPQSYPPPREKCAVPSCTNPYKYRDSKSKLPLCSLQCYKAIHA